MQVNETSCNLWTVVKLEDRLFAIPVDYVQTMVTLPEISLVPEMPDYIRGVINLRGSVMPVVDLRIRLGISSVKQEVSDLITMLNHREQDHVRWIDELEKSVVEKKEFKLATDPHKCAFGVWYDSYVASNLILLSHLKKFDVPHKRIHAVAERVLSLEKSGRLTDAKKVINDTRNNELAEMVKLFETLRAMLTESVKEIAIVLTAQNHTYAVTVDSVETVTELCIDETNRIENLCLEMQAHFLDAIGKMGKSDQLVFTLDPEKLYDNEYVFPSVH
jgi:chemotaxis signal transduction protein